jgi:hypothetical protein
MQPWFLKMRKGSHSQKGYHSGSKSVKLPRTQRFSSFDEEIGCSGRFYGFLAALCCSNALLASDRPSETADFANINH